MRIDVRILDGTYGQAAVEVPTRLDCPGLTSWITAASATTGPDGRIKDLGGRDLPRGLYRIVLNSDRYFAGLGVSSAYPEVGIIFRMLNEDGNYHIDIALSPYSHSVYFIVASGQPDFPENGGQP